jgi:hypothetical protein
LVSRQPLQPEEVGENRINEGIARLNHMAHPGSVILLLSDFMGLEDEGKKAIIGLTRKSDVFSGFIYDPLEESPPAAGRYRFGTPSDQVQVDTAAAAAKNIWRKGFAYRMEHVQELSRRSSMSFAAISTEMEAKKVIQQYFRFSSGRIV